MSNLKSLTLKDIAAPGRSVISGPFGSSIGKRFFQSSGIPVIRGNNLTTDFKKFKDEGFVFLSEKKADELKADALQMDILFTAAGTIGQVGMIPKTSKFERYVISNKQLRFRVDKQQADPEFVYYWLASPWIKKTIENRNTGSTVPLINLGIIKSLPISLPENIQEQKKISGLLSSMDNKIELNNKIVSELEAMAKLIYDYWFVQFDFPDANGNPYKSSGGKMVYNQELKRETPEGWKIGELSDLAKIKAGGDKPNIVSTEKTLETPIPIYSNGIQNFGLYGFTEIAKIVSPSITLSARGTIGVAFLRMEPFVPIIRLIVVTPKNNNFLFYLNELLKNTSFENSGSVQKQLTAPQISKLKILLPSSDILERHTSIIENFVKKIELSKNENNELRVLRGWLLPMLMNGQVTISNN